MPFGCLGFGFAGFCFRQCYAEEPNSFAGGPIAVTNGPITVAGCLIAVAEFPIFVVGWSITLLALFSPMLQGGRGMLCFLLACSNHCLYLFPSDENQIDESVLSKFLRN